MSDLVLISACAFGAVVIGLFGLRGLVRDVPRAERQFQDPLPFALRLLWPLVSAASAWVAPRLKPAGLSRAHRALQAAGQDYLVSPEELAGLRIVAAVLASAALLLVSSMLGRDGVFAALSCVAIGAPLGWLYPTLWLRERRKLRQKRVIRDLPVFLDFITMAIEAGLNTSGAIELAVRKTSQGPLSQEFSRMLRDLRAGLPRAEAVRRMAERMDTPQVWSFASALIQADRVGASLSESLRAQAAQRREERFLRAEKLALEAPVKMMVPLVTCFFPLIFMVLGYFIYLRLIEDGIL
ncbi:type II secretion system F family protein [Lysobacter sp. GCM10012299]|uniref:type II secretion system F family protein n=1 Tax=Lysobacter sp. GCM10012299 TaxID=3317333 RepID=UPI00361485EE